MRDRSGRALVILFQAAASIYLTGVIWIIQIVHYPAFARIDQRHFTDFHANHSRAMTWLVGPVMIAEVASAAWLARTGNPAWILNLLSVLVPFGATFALSVPCHERLAEGPDAAQIRRLVRTNWVRTIGWTARAAVFSFLFAFGTVDVCAPT